MVGKTIAIRGIADGNPYVYPRATHNTDFYRLRDSEGFEIKFIPRGNRKIDLGSKYTIKGTVEVEDFDIFGKVHYVQEIKP